MSQKTDAELIRLIRELGDATAYGQLIERYQGHAYGLAYSIIDDWTEAQDIAQEAFVRAYVNLHTLEKPEKFPAWLRRIVFSTCINWIQRHRPELYRSMGVTDDMDALEDLPDTQTATPLEHTLKSEMSQVVLSAIADLPQKYRIPLTMFHLDGLSYQKVADFLEIPIGTVRTLIYRAKKKLKPALESYAQEVFPMVKEVLDEHKLTEEFTRSTMKKIEGVPKLTWTGKTNTFAGALEAATAVTEHPCSYTDIMGLTGLAFRVRWSRWQDDPDWCPSCAIGEMPEETSAISRLIGWQFLWDEQWDQQHPDKTKVIRRIMKSIDAGIPVVVYGNSMDMAVAIGYEDGGDKLLLHEYGEDETPFSLPGEKLGPMQIYLGGFMERLSSRDALIEALYTAVAKWRQPRGDGGIAGRDYWYGSLALKKWARDITDADKFPEEARQVLKRVSGFALASLLDARIAAIAFLEEKADKVAEDAGRMLLKAAAIYQQEVDLLGSVIKQKLTIPKAFPEAIKIETKAIAKIENALELLSHAYSD